MAKMIIFVVPGSYRTQEVTFRDISASNVLGKVERSGEEFGDYLKPKEASGRGHHALRCTSFVREHWDGEDFHRLALVD